MPFTAQEIENYTNAALDYHSEKGKVNAQTLQNKPLLRDMRAKQKTFPSGKDNITVRVKGDYTTTIQGYTADDTVAYGNPANIRTAAFPWKEIHSGIKVTLTELKKDGISVVDSTTGKQTVEHSGREMTALANLLEDKIDDMEEGTDRGMNLMYWQDGSQDNLLIPGVRSFITNTPAAGVVIGGIDQGLNTWWRNRAVLNIDSTSNSGNQNLVNTLQKEMRQLRRFGSPKTKFYCGSDFLDAFERELRAKGNYTLEGWSKNGTIDASIADVAFKGVALEYDPTLDDLGLSKYCFALDWAAIAPYVMEGEDMKRHSPARPAEKYVLYRAITYTGGLVIKQRNTSAVYSIL